MCSVYRIHTMRSSEVIKYLVADGWEQVHSKGSHRKFRHPAKPGHVVVPHPKHELPVGTLRSTYRQAGWDWSER